MSDSNYEQTRVRIQKAVFDFQELRRKAALQGVLDQLLGRRSELLSYDEVRTKLRAVESARRELKDIPLDKIVGSVGRITDFTRSFLPLNESAKDRWARVRAGVDALGGLPPIEAYQVGEVYFVLDGHHRVSVAHELGARQIEGYVIPVYTRVPLSPGDSPDDLIIKAEYADFLARTQFDHLRSDASLLVSAPGQYPKILEHISVHRYFLGLKQKREVTEKEAIADWYDAVYQPIAELIGSRNLLRDFPHRTETDLYLWIMDHRATLSDGGLGWEVAPEKAARDLATRFSPRLGQRLSRMARRVAGAIIPEPLTQGPPAGAWRAEAQSPHRGDHLFDDILVTVLRGKASRGAQNMAFEIARREQARLTGLHVVSSEAEKDSPEVAALKDQFARRCEEEGIFGRLVVETGQAAQIVCARSPWVDLAVFRLAYPPPQRVFKRLRSGIRTLIRRCSAPLLAAPDAPYNLNSALLSYGPGRKSEEALYVAAYLAGRWQIPLTVVTVQKEGETPPSPTPLERAQAYLESQQVEARYVVEEMADPALSVLLNAEIHNAGFIITGGYESSPLRESVAGSTVDRILRSTRRPVLICR
jgi:nucleotide-binding universal stress UspA family protein